MGSNADITSGAERPNGFAPVQIDEAEVANRGQRGKSIRRQVVVRSKGVWLPADRFRKGTVARVCDIEHAVAAIGCVKSADRRTKPLFSWTPPEPHGTMGREVDASVQCTRRPHHHGEFSTGDICWRFRRRIIVVHIGQLGGPLKICASGQLKCRLRLCSEGVDRRSIIQPRVRG
jgi:hypothetical protein